MINTLYYTNYWNTSFGNWDIILKLSNLHFQNKWILKSMSITVEFWIVKEMEIYIHLTRVNKDW